MRTDLEYLLYDPSRHGQPRWYVRIRGRKARIKGVESPPPFPATKDAHDAYWAARADLNLARPDRRDHASLLWLVEAYFASPTFARLHDLTKRERRSVLGRVCDKHGAKPFALMEPRHVAKLRDELDGDRANKRVKCLRYLFKWALENQHATRNPARTVELIRVPTEGYTAWTRDDVQAFERRHPVGTKARLAFALMLYTGLRRSDVAQLGPLNIRGDRLVLLQHKGKGLKPRRRDIPLVAPLRAILEASALGKTTFLETEFGKPFSIAGFGGWFRKRCDEAGLTELSAHGVRKAVGVMSAERGCTSHQIMEILGVSLQVAEIYTRQASAKKLGDAGFTRLYGLEQEQNLSHQTVPPKKTS